MQKILDILYQGKHLNINQTEKLFYKIKQKKISETQIVSILISMKIRGENFKEIIGATNFILKDSQPFNTPNEPFADIVGTGGDGKNTINISTISAIVASTCNNVKIIKHGNYSISGLIGSMDVMQSNYTNSTPTMIYQTRKKFDTLGICFLSASQYHKIFQQVSSIRKKLKTPTLFNIIGPLVNPARPVLILIGVYKRKLMQPMIQALKKLNYQHAIVVHCGGMDEVGLHDNTYVSELHYGHINNYILTASDFGLNYQSIESLYCYSKAQAQNNMENLLKGKGDPAHKFVIAANIALLLKLFGYKNLRNNAELALEKMCKDTPYKIWSKLTKQ